MFDCPWSRGSLERPRINHEPSRPCRPLGFKGCLDPGRVAGSIASGLRRASDAVNVRELALVDGGEGTAATLALATNGELRPERVTGPLGEELDAPSRCSAVAYEGAAVVELAAAAGLSRVPPDRRDPMRTTTRGVGELLLAALDAGATGSSSGAAIPA